MNSPSCFQRRFACAVLAFCVGLSTLEAADNATRTLQRALAERGFYTAPQPSGVMDEKTTAALKRFQIRQGLNVSGQADADTLKALAIPAPGKTVPAQNKMSSVRERSQQLVTSDREFLAAVDTMEKTAAHPQRVPEAHPAPRSLPPVAEPPRDDSDRKLERTSDRQPEVSSAQDEPATTVREADAIAFVHDYIQAAHGPSPAAEVAHYASEVDYFDHGKVSRAFIGKDQARYYARWPQRDFKLLGEPKVDRTSVNGATVRFRVAYRLIGKGENAAGRTEEVVRLRRDGSALRIVGIRERKLE
jgi:hypothetical protein